ncbi:MAG: DNA polymerase III subunit alpha [Rickettsiales bacterium]|jgi:DNA polymerase-3 subunit alpha|nr:DNA polymerase III subunit alpha [Rickettsiales bacterium]
MTNFIHLRNHTEYSLCKGAIKIKKIISHLKEENVPAFAMTDSHVMFGALEFCAAAMKEGIQPIIGCEIVLNINNLIFKNGEKSFSLRDEEKNFCKVVALAQTDKGYLNLISLITKSYLERRGGVLPNIPFERLREKREGLIILSGASEGCFEKLLLENQSEKAEEVFKAFLDVFGNKFYVELQRHGWEKEEKVEPAAIDLAYKYGVPLAATNDCYFIKKSMFEAQDALSCIADGKYVSETDRSRLTPEHYVKSEEEMGELFQDIPEALKNTVDIAKRISAMAYGRKPTLPHFLTESGADEGDELIRLSKIGLEERLKKKFEREKIAEENWDKTRKQYAEQMEYELNTIIKMDFAGYFLIVSDFIIWSKNNGVPIGPGRGSGAGSIVAWSLKITDLDPIRFSLFFERFLNPERVSMPDFDIDLCQRGRERTIEYVKNKYGADMVAQIITFGKLQAKAVVRDIGRVLQMSYGEVDKISKMIPFNTELEDALNMDPGLRKQRQENEQVDRLLTIALQLEGLNRHSSVHAAGVVIGDKPLEQICPLYFDGESEMPVAQYTMKYVEEVGLVKFDFLGLKTLTIIKDTITCVKNIKNIDINIDDIDLNDPGIYEMLRAADSVAVFQIESSGMRGMLKQIQPDNIEDIIALISLYRPGPMDSIPTYVRRKHKKENVEYPHEKVANTLKDTYGIIIYQEQVMDMAKILAGYTLGGADLLRRAMGKKIKEEMDKQRNIFVDGCAKHSNIEEKKANEIFDLLAKFAEYGFNKAHAASYAVIGIQTAYLKKYFPAEFMAANMNIELRDTDKINFLLEDVKKHGIKILPPDINISEEYFTVELIDIEGNRDEKTNKYHGDKELAIRYSLSAIKGVGVEMIADVMGARRSGGNFKDIFDFCERSGTKIINKKTIEALAKSGAFDSIHPNRKQIFDSFEVLNVFTRTREEERKNPQLGLFDAFETEHKIYPRLASGGDDWQGYERMQREFEAFGFYLGKHPMDAIRKELDRKGVSFLGDVLSNEELKEGAIIKLAGVVISTSVKSSDKGRYAFLTLSDPTGLAEVSLFDNDLLVRRKDWLDDREHRQLVAECSVVRKENAEPRLIARELWLLDDFLREMKGGEEKIKYIKKRNFDGLNFKNFNRKDGKETESGEFRGEEKIIASLKLRVNSLEAAQSLQKILSSHGKTNGKFTEIELFILDKKIQLPPNYKINIATLNDIANMDGAEDVSWTPEDDNSQR